MSYALVVDDSRSTRLFVRRLLEGLGYETREAGSCAEALALVDPTAPPAFVLIDWELPDGVGVDLLNRWCEDPRLAQMRLIMMTARDAADDVRQALVAGADEFLMKPITRESLAEKLALLEFEWTSREQGN